MRRFGIAILWGFGLLVATALLLILFLATAPDGFYRWAARSLLENSVDRQIHVDGKVSLDVGLHPVIVATDIWIENAAWADDKEIARIEHSEARLSLPSLSSGIVLLERLVIKGLTLNLETSEDGRHNWESLEAGDEREPETALARTFYPLLDVVTVTEVLVDYRDRQSDEQFQFVLKKLQNQRSTTDNSQVIHGEGSVNNTAFRIEGQSGSVEDAIAASAPYPFELKLEAAGVVAALKGTAKNFPRARGFDMRLTAQAPKITPLLEALKVNLGLAARAETSARLRGDLESLAVEDFFLELAGTSGQEVRATGKITDLFGGKGLDLRITGKLGRDALRLLMPISNSEHEILSDVSRLDIDGRITGDLKTPAFGDVRAKLEHRSGAILSVTGTASLDLGQGELALTGFQAKTDLSLPDPILLEQTLGIRLPATGAVSGTSRLSWANEWVTIQSLKLEAASFGGLQLNAKGQLGKLTAKELDLRLDPKLDLSVSMKESQPLANLFEKQLSRPSKGAQPALAKRSGNLTKLTQEALTALGYQPGSPDGILGPKTRAAIKAYQTASGLTIDGKASHELLQRLERELGGMPNRSRESVWGLEAILENLIPILATGQLSARDGVYRLDDLRIAVGAKGSSLIEASGILGKIRTAGGNPIEDIDLKINFDLPSSRTLGWERASEVPELKNIRGRFDARGSAEALSLSKVRIEADGEGGSSVSTSGQVRQLALMPSLSIKGLGFELELRSPDTAGISHLIGIALPELGPATARAKIEQRSTVFAMTGIDASIGPLKDPIFNATGEIGDLLDMEQVTLTGEFETEAAGLLKPYALAGNPVLGDVHGHFEISDTDGNLGIDKMEAGVKGTELLEISVKGLVKDLAQGKGVDFRAKVQVPSISALSQELGLEENELGPFSFDGQVLDRAEKFHFRGKSQLGETSFSGSLYANLTGTRPAFRGEISSPVFHFADFGLVPKAHKAAASGDAIQEADTSGRHRIFSTDPIPFEALKNLDVEVSVLLGELVGTDLEIDKAKGRLKLDDGLLKLDPLRFDFVGGHMEGNLLVDARSKSPKVGLDLVVDDVDLGKFLQQVGVNVPLDGDLDLTLNIEGHGSSERALSSSVSGKLDLALANGHIRTSLVDLAAIGLGGWIFSESRRKGYSKLNCLVAHFSLDDGLARNDGLLIDTPNSRVLAKGEIDLRNETINLEFDPQPKSWRLVKTATPFSLKGPLDDPSVQISEVGTAGRMVGGLALSPLRFLGSLLPMVSDGGKDTTNACLQLPNGRHHPQQP